MTNKDFQKLLQQYPDDILIRLLPKQENNVKAIVDFTDENILLTSEGAYVDDEADPETWDHEDGKIRHKGERYLLLNPIIH
jgi:hypothetical protein